MNYRQLSEAEIYNIVDKEISAGKLNSACEAEATLESKGNFDLMISRYFLLRVEGLRKQQVKVEDKASALDQRKVAAATERIRYRSTSSNSNTLEEKQKKLDRLTVIFGNLILAISATGAMLALTILKGSTLHNISYPILAGVVTVIMFLPFVISKVKIGSTKASYQSVLMSICALMCLSSASSGLLLMKTDPPVYAKEDNSEKPAPLSVIIAPANTTDSVVQNP